MSKHARSSSPAAAEEVAGDIHDGGMEEDDDDIGPLPMPAEGGEEEGRARKKRKVDPHQSLHLKNLPSAQRYHRSFMHRDALLWTVAARPNRIITVSQDGIVKFWRKEPKSSALDFLKLIRSHLHPPAAVSLSSDHAVFATCAPSDTPGKGQEGVVKVFDVANCDMINILPLPFLPLACAWIHKKGSSQTLLAISEDGGNAIRIYDGRGDGTPLHTLGEVHRNPVHILAYNNAYDTVVSCDTSGMLEYWDATAPFTSPPEAPGVWRFKSDTDLYTFRKTKTLPTSLSISPTGHHFAVLSSSSSGSATSTTATGGRTVQIFTFATGKLYRSYDESVRAVSEMQQAGTGQGRLDDMEFGRRLAVERDVERSLAGGGLVKETGKEGGKEGTGRQVRNSNVVWSEEGGFVAYGGLLGIKVVNITTSKVVRLLGKEENHRFLQLALLQEKPGKKFGTIEAAASDNPLLNEEATLYPMLICTAYKRSRFFIFTTLEPESETSHGHHGDRDVLNEKPTREELNLALSVASANAVQLAKEATIHTTVGDVKLRLFPNEAPKAVENFCGLVRKGYYDGIIFHRVIPKFMIQTGDPLGDGTGGESLWGRNFEDEFHPKLKHDRPYTLSMANAGANTNGSQFFITTVPTPWLDNKHTIFGRAVAGLDVIHSIENVRVDKTDKPLDDIKIVGIDLGN